MKLVNSSFGVFTPSSNKLSNALAEALAAGFNISGCLTVRDGDVEDDKVVIEHDVIFYNCRVINSRIETKARVRLADCRVLDSRIIGSLISAVRTNINKSSLRGELYLNETILGHSRLEVEAGLSLSMGGCMGDHVEFEVEGKVTVSDCTFTGATFDECNIPEGDVWSSSFNIHGGKVALNNVNMNDIMILHGQFKASLVGCKVRNIMMTNCQHAEVSHDECEIKQVFKTSSFDYQG